MKVNDNFPRSVEEQTGVPDEDPRPHPRPLHFSLSLALCLCLSVCLSVSLSLSLSLSPSPSTSHVHSVLRHCSLFAWRFPQCRNRVFTHKSQTPKPACVWTSTGWAGTKESTHGRCHVQTLILRAYNRSTHSTDAGTYGCMQPTWDSFCRRMVNIGVVLFAAGTWSRSAHSPGGCKRASNQSRLSLVITHCQDNVMGCRTSPRFSSR